MAGRIEKAPSYVWRVLLASSAKEQIYTQNNTHPEERTHWKPGTRVPPSPIELGTSGIGNLVYEFVFPYSIGGSDQHVLFCIHFMS